MSAADWLSVARVPLGMVFLLVAGRVSLALAVLAVAALTDVLDGWVARRHQRRPDQPHRGDWLDPLCDKLFALSVVIGLLLTGETRIAYLVLMLSREIVQVLAMIALRLLPSLQRAARAYDFRAHPLGKAATVAQFLTAAALVLRHPSAGGLAASTAILGLASTAIYIHRVRGVSGARSVARKRA